MMPNERILVVDDEEDILELVRFNLSKEGYRVCCSETGESAVEIARSDSIKAKVDPTLLEQAIVNLLDNAVKYSNDGGNIRLMVAKETDFVTIEIDLRQNLVLNC